MSKTNGGSSPVVSKRMEGLVLLNCQMSNHNGDPDGAGNPRVDPIDNRGIMRDAAPKRRIRDYIEAVFKLALLVRRGSDLNTRIAEAHASANGKLPEVGKDGKYKTNLKSSELAGLALLASFIDARLFGFVGETGANAGQFIGPIQFGHARSVCKINLIQMALTRCADALNPSDWPDEIKKPLADIKVADYKAAEKAMPANSLRSMGRTCVADHALFPIKWFLSVAQAQKAGLTEADFQMFLEACLNLYEGPNRTGSKSDMAVRGLVLFRHVGTAADAEDRAREASKGCAPAHALFDLVKIAPKIEQPTCFADYDIKINVGGIPQGVEMGFCRYDGAKVQTEWITTGGKLPKWLPENMTAGSGIAAGTINQK